MPHLPLCRQRKKYFQRNKNFFILFFSYLIYIYEENIFWDVELSVFSLDLFIHDAQNVLLLDPKPSEATRQEKVVYVQNLSLLCCLKNKYNQL